MARDANVATKRRFQKGREKEPVLIAFAEDGSGKDTSTTIRAPIGWNYLLPPPKSSPTPVRRMPTRQGRALTLREDCRSCNFVPPFERDRHLTSPHNVVRCGSPAGQADSPPSLNHWSSSNAIARGFVTAPIENK